jgi:serine O-acetyltransferase
MRQSLKIIKDDFTRHRGEPMAFFALSIYRFGRWALDRKQPALRWLLLKIHGFFHFFVYNVLKIDLPPNLRIGDAFHIIHTTGALVIHPDVVIGDRCGVMHNVTIGMNMTGGVPRIGDDVFIGVNATVLGPITIGDRVRIGANTAVATNVPSDSVVIGSPAKIYPRLGKFG